MGIKYIFFLIIYIIIYCKKNQILRWWHGGRVVGTEIIFCLNEQILFFLLLFEKKYFILFEYSMNGYEYIILLCSVLNNIKKKPCKKGKKK